MKRLMQVFVLLFCALICVDAQAFETNEKKAAPSFSAFWTKFKAAVAKDDKEAVASMTKLPYPYWTGREMKNLDKAAFIKIYPRIFTRSVKRCFTKAKPVREEVDPNSYSVFCGNEIYVFTLVDGTFKFIEVGADDA
jgi:hypothetical protein